MLNKLGDVSKEIAVKPSLALVREPSVGTTGKSVVVATEKETVDEPSSCGSG